jgi:hypothetical protein
MSSRGTFARNGHATTDEYVTVETLESGAKVLEGKNHKHSLPDYSHSPNAVYIKKNPDGTFREIRIYGKDGYPIIEIGYHPESFLNKSNKKDLIWHYILFGPNFDRGLHPSLIDNNIKVKYAKYLKEAGYDQW